MVKLDAVYATGVTVTHAAPPGRLCDCLAIDQGLRLRRPAIRIVYSSQRCPGQWIKGLLATHAAVPELATGFAPRTNVIATAVRASKACETTLADL